MTVSVIERPGIRVLAVLRHPRFSLEWRGFSDDERDKAVAASWLAKGYPVSDAEVAPYLPKVPRTKASEAKRPAYVIRDNIGIGKSCGVRA